MFSRLHNVDFWFLVLMSECSIVLVTEYAAVHLSRVDVSAGNSLSTHQ